MGGQTHECGCVLPLGIHMMVIAALVVSALGIVLGAFGWGWTHGTASESAQERFDREFERIVSGFGRRPPG